jgi:hypothetical protein
MVRITAGFALVLVALGVGLYLGTGRESVTALIPAFLGVALFVCAALGRKASRRMHAMHAAAVLALLGVGGSAPGVVGAIKHLGGEAPGNVAATWGRAAMALLCVAYLVIAVRSFVAARRARQAAGD